RGLPKPRVAGPRPVVRVTRSQTTLRASPGACGRGGGLPQGVNATAVQVPAAVAFDFDPPSVEVRGTRKRRLQPRAHHPNERLKGLTGRDRVESSQTPSCGRRTGNPMPNQAG